MFVSPYRMFANPLLSWDNVLIRGFTPLVLLVELV
jgi:hypothetical protein